MASEKLMLIINPHSGVNSKQKLQHTLFTKLGSMGFDVDMRLTQARGHATELAREAVEMKVDKVAVCGGDGTINEVATALCGSSVVMAIVPSGSGNGLARHLRIPIDERLSLAVIKSGHLRKCDCGMANDRPFFCTAGMGFDAHISVLFDKQKKRGFINYTKLVLREFASYKPRNYRITVNGRTFERRAMVLTVCNASQYGNNAYVAPHASVSDGMLDIFILEECTTPALVMAGMEVMAGMADRNKHVEIIRASEATIELEPGCCMHLDGEPIEHAPSTVRFTCQGQKLSIMAGNASEKITPIITPLGMMAKQAAMALTKPFR